MADSDSVAQDNKLRIIFRVEPGCLGPEGLTHIESFCELAQQEISLIYPAFIAWQIIPRYDKSLAEIQYLFHNKNLSEAQAQKYLDRFSVSLDELVEQLQQAFVDLVEHYMQK